MPSPAKACSGKGAEAKKCQAKERLTKALARCNKLKGKQKKTCVKKAKLAYKRELAKIKCQSLKKTKRAACIRKAKKIKK